MLLKNKILRNLIATVCLTCLTIVFVIVSFLSSDSYAADHNITFGFTIEKVQGTAYLPSNQKRYRQTKYVKNPWKVDFAWSQEGYGTYMNFTLALARKDLRGYTAGWKRVRVGHENYYNARSLHNQNNVILAGQNNNWNYKKYIVSGYWDEETW
jgi:hypothetical protein